MRVILYLLPLFLLACDNSPEMVDNIDPKQSSKIPAPIALPVASYIGRESCSSCHEQQMQEFTGSHHDLAMQHVSSESILGDFDDVTFTYNGITSTFFKRDDNFFINTDGDDGELTDFEIKYVFGVEPLQQYLVETEPGRLQALSIAWDSRPGDEGGQQWFHLYPDEPIDYQDPLHWTTRNHNWNYMCAECHSTQLEKNFDVENNRYTTTWSEIDVSCESCHGPASNHVNLAKTLDEDEFKDIERWGLVTDFSDATKGNWQMSVDHPIAALDIQRDNDILIGACARCHSRRTPVVSPYDPTKSFHEQYIVSLLDDGLYHPDGQINDEVYVYGSFVQSKMYQAGVTCTDCHDPHSLKLKAEGNALCLQCHKGEEYNAPAHHFHETGTAASECTTCHMPAKTYMVVDPRRDHSFKVPHPELTSKTGSPNVCNQCHVDETAEWAADIIAEKSNKPAQVFHYAEALSQARDRLATASSSLAEAARDTSLPFIVRATAISQLAPYLSPENIDVIMSGLNSSNPVVRTASINALYNAPVEDRFNLLARLLNDPVKTVRLAATSSLASTNNTGIPAAQQQTLSIAIREYLASLQVNNDRAFAHTNMGNIYMDLREYKNSEAAYLKAIEMEPDFLPTYNNLAELYRVQGDEQKAEETLMAAISVDGQFAPFHYSLALSKIRQKEYEASLPYLEKASNISPDDSQIAMVYGIALNTLERPQEAWSLLESYLERNPDDSQITMTLATIYRDHGEIEQAIEKAQRLMNLLPGDEQAMALLEQLRALR